MSGGGGPLCLWPCRRRASCGGTGRGICRLGHPEERSVATGRRRLPWGGVLYFKLGVGRCSYDASTILYLQIQCVRGSVGDHIQQEFNTLHLTRFRSYQIATPPQLKTYEGRGPQTDKHLPKSPLNQVNFFCIFVEVFLFGCHLVIKPIAVSASY